jgi:HEAT repeat protein
MQYTTYTRHLGLVIAIALALVAAMSAHAQETPAPASLDEAFALMRSYPVGGPPAAPQYIIDQIMATHGDVAARTDLANRLVGLLDADTTVEAKRFAALQLCIVATEAEVPRIAPLLTDETLSSLARYALEPIPGAAVDAALLEALANTSGHTRIGMANSLGERKSATATAALAGLLTQDDVLLVQAASAALAKIATVEARQALLESLGAATGATREVLVDAVLSSADALLAGGDVAGAAALYTRLEDPAFSRRVQFAALRGLLQADEAGRAARLTAALASDAPHWARDVMGFARSLPGEGVTLALANALDTVPAATQALLIGALADRADPAARAAVMARVASSDAAVRTAALDALGVLGDADAVASLAQAAATGEGDAKAAARRSLTVLKGAQVDEVIARSLRKATPDERVELIRALADRGAVAAVSSLMRETKAQDMDSRREAYRALGQLAPGDQVPTLLKRLQQAKTGDETDWAGQAVVQAARRIPETEGPSKHVLAAYAAAKTDALRETLLGLLPSIADEASLPLVQELAADPNSVLHAAAVRGLAAWRGLAAREAVLGVVQSESDDALQAVALEGYLRMLREDRSMPPNVKYEYYAAALPLARETASRRRVLAGLSDVPDVRALDLLAPYLNDAALGKEASVAMEKIRRQFYVPTASHGTESVKDALDMNIGTRWSSGANQTLGMWFQLDLAGEARVGGVVLDASRSPGDSPVGYAVYVFSDPTEPGEPVATGAAGTEDVLEISFEPKQGRYLRIVQTGESAGHWWSIHELRVIAK